MTAIKAYTDILQSKKLAEILPAESADQIWERIAIAGANLDVPEEMEYWHNGNIPYFLSSRCGVPCWSLAALLEVLPTIDDGNRNPVVCKDIRLNKWHIVYHGTAVEPTIDSGVYDNLIDACVEMIYKLKERGLL